MTRAKNERIELVSVAKGPCMDRLSLYTVNFPRLSAPLYPGGVRAAEAGRTLRAASADEDSFPVNQV